MGVTCFFAYLCTAKPITIRIMRKLFTLLTLAVLLCSATAASAQQRRPVDNRHPLWLVHVDVWNSADPQKIIDLIPEDIKPYVCMNLSLSCQYDTQTNMYRMPRSAVRTYKSWASVCQLNNMWFTCQPASGGHTHIQDNDLETFEYFFKTYPNFLGWNYAEQFWGFDEADDKSSSSQASRIALFAKLVPMHHKYGGFLTVSFCGNIWSHPLNPIGMMKRNSALLQACKDYPEAILWLYKYTTSSCFYNNETVTFGPFISGLAKNYGVRYDNCGWNGAIEAILGKNSGKTYPGSAGIGTVMEQTCVNGGAVWDGPELIWTEDFQNLSNSTVDGYTRRNWGTFPNFRGVWLDMWRKIIDGTMYIPTREEVVAKTKIVILNDLTSGSDEDRYATWANLYDGLYRQDDPFNNQVNGYNGKGQWMNNFCYFKSTGRYGAIPMVTGLYDDAAKNIPVQVKKSGYEQRWSTQAKKVADFNAQYPEVSKGDLYVNRYQNQLVTYTPYTYLNGKKKAEAAIPLQYNTCDSLKLTYAKLSSGIIREYEDHIDFYLNNYRSDSTSTLQTDVIVVTGVTEQPAYKLTTHKTGANGQAASVSGTPVYDAGKQTYTLNVRHMGPVDVRIDCKGTREGRESSLPHEALPLPKQPEDVTCPIIIEAENMDYKSISSVSLTHSGWWAQDMKDFAGMGYVTMGTSTSGALRHQLKLKKAGSYTLKVRYCNSSKGGSMSATINGTAKTLQIEKTAKNAWCEAAVSMDLKAGTNDLVLRNSGAINMIIDQIIYEPEGTQAEKYKVTIADADNGSVTCDVDSAVAGQTVTLKVLPAEGYGVRELRVINSVFYTQGWTIPVAEGAAEATFVMPEDNVTIRPAFYDNSSVYALDYTNVQNGTFPEGWRTTEGSEVRNYPYSNSSGPRTFVGFAGYQGKALYWRNGTAEYGRLSAYPLTLEPGDYKLVYAMAAWKASPAYKVNILDASNKVIKSSASLTATPNVNGNSSGNVSSAELQELAFTVTKAGKHVIQFSRTSNGYDEYLLLECRVRKVVSTGITTATAMPQRPAGIYSVSGVRRESLQPGLNIIVGDSGETRKVFVK